MGEAEEAEEVAGGPVLDQVRGEDPATRAQPSPLSGEPPLYLIEDDGHHLSLNFVRGNNCLPLHIWAALITGKIFLDG